MDRNVDKHIAELRRKLEDDPKKPRYILSVHGFGYKFCDW
jgi:DNA-binding response OmpR family regulator